MDGVTKKNTHKQTRKQENKKATRKQKSSKKAKYVALGAQRSVAETCRVISEGWRLRDQLFLFRLSSDTTRLRQL
jgi:hypothetical protein